MFHVLKQPDLLICNRGFLNPHALDSLGWITCRGCPVCCEVFPGVPALYPLDTISTLPPKLRQVKMSSDIAKCSLGTKIARSQGPLI